MRAMRPAAYETFDMGRGRVMDGDEASEYMDQCERDIAELVEALERYNRAICSTFWQTDDDGNRIPGTPDSLDEDGAFKIAEALRFASPILVKHKGASNE